MTAPFRGLILPALATLADGVLRILAVITIDGVNKLLALVIALLSIAHLIIKIRKETRDK